MDVKPHCDSSDLYEGLHICQARNVPSELMYIEAILDVYKHVQKTL